MSFRVIVSPAKKMNVVEGPPYVSGLPSFLGRTAELMRAIQALSRDEAQTLWKCNDRLCDLNFDRFAHMDLTHGLTAAVLSYEGIQYQHLAAEVMDEDGLAWLDEHLRILSGFYGVLRPFDGVVPYRLEMQARLAVGGAKNLYAYWGASLAGLLAAEGCETLVNLASVEYAKAVAPHMRGLGIPVLTCLFGTVRQSDGRLVQRSTEAKAARGTFVRWCAENDVRDTRDFASFDERGYALDEVRSTEDTLVFVS